MNFFMHFLSRGAKRAERPHNLDRGRTSLMRASLFVSASILLLSVGSLPSCFGQCANNCSKQGICNNLGVCECSENFSGADCSQRTCPKGTAFSDVAESSDTAHLDTVCSGRGGCVDGNCICHDGFTGIACERTTCKNDCSHRGQCVSMRHLAETTRSHDSQQYSYNLWDADKIYGCVCDLGYTGFDCSLRECPRGDDPLTTDDTDQEVQLLRCTADDSSGGRLILCFDGKPSASIPVDASVTVLKTALETIPIVEKVDISYSEGTVLCRNDGIHNIVRITFASNFGPL